MPIGFAELLDESEFASIGKLCRREASDQEGAARPGARTASADGVAGAGRHGQTIDIKASIPLCFDV